MTAAVQSENNRQIVDIASLPQAIIVGTMLALLGNIVMLYVGRAFGTPFHVMPPGADALEPLTALPLIFASLLPAIGAAVLLAILPRYTERPFTIFWVIAVAFLIFSFWGPTPANTDSESTIMGLNFMHVMTGVAIIGALSALARGEEIEE